MGLLDDWPKEESEAKARHEEWLYEKPKDLRGVYRFLGPEPGTWYSPLWPIAVGPDRKLRAAMPDLIRSSLIGLVDLAAATKTGVLTPEALQAVTTIPSTVGAFTAPVGTLAANGSRRVLPGAGNALPNLRSLPADEAMAIARKEPHLIERGAPSQGRYVGGPGKVRTYEDLEANRRRLDQRIEAGAEGADWYDRSRAAVNEVTGGDPVANKWMTSQHAQWSGGVSPEVETAFALRENNASIAGVPHKAARTWQHQAHLRAVKDRDPSRYRLGMKTGEYQRHIEPARSDAHVDPHNVATGVNDLRWASEHGYTEPPRGAAHTFIDYETALATDRANRRRAADRSDWTGPQAQAAGWVRRKANDLLEQRPAILRSRLSAVEERAAREGLSGAEKKALIDQAMAEANAEAFAIANRQMGDYFNKHAALDVHGFQPGASVTGHMPRSVSADSGARSAYAGDPRSTWATAPGRRDSIYSGLQVPGTGVSMRVRPTTHTRAATIQPDGRVNPGETAQPLVAYVRGPGGIKGMPHQDRALLDAASFVRSALDAQDAARVVKTWEGGSVSGANALRTALDRPLSPRERMEIAERLRPHGLTDVVDTGRGIVAGNFAEAARAREALKAAQDDIRQALPGTDPRRTTAETVDTDLTPFWTQGEASGAVTDELLRRVNSNPTMREVFDQNPYIAEPARARAARDEEWAETWGAPRQDIQNLRGIVGEGPGWVARLEDARRNRSVSLPIHGPVPVNPLAGVGASATGEAGVPYARSEAELSEDARNVISQVVLDRARRRKEDWLRRNPQPVRPYIPPYRPIA